MRAGRIGAVKHDGSAARNDAGKSANSLGHLHSRAAPGVLRGSPKFVAFPIGRPLDERDESNDSAVQSASRQSGSKSDVSLDSGTGFRDGRQSAPGNMVFIFKVRSDIDEPAVGFSYGIFVEALRRGAVGKRGIHLHFRTAPECDEDRVRASMEQMARMNDMTREEALGLLKCHVASEEDHQFVEDRFPNYQSEPDPKNTDEYDVYHARLKVMSELQPRTVELLKIASGTKDPVKRKFVEREAVQSFFAELAHYLTEDEILAWQRSNPVGTGWMCEFGEVMREPRRTISRVNHELALNWLRDKYNLLTEKELSVSVFKRILIWLTPSAIKKRRERLGLTSKRKPGPRPKSASP